ncbi:NADH dehydrogenase [ubiquinone] iron-sulfur protein 6, mitochondrial-like [Uranotaenia lowii]|uniref:NADH dehydrogenase [ubiquinone] iron-sulfur protein 6, mitochondrial-like n=1 Tax=Uranotaenia lowii TaxID=190385 RepID=UPI0024794B37|nr:NADH dehydrogenase [ubiquinone] iron-sulfur protein 6, mitochondrial-like [Uranotaenia lowii]
MASRIFSTSTRALQLMRRRVIGNQIYGSQYSTIKDEITHTGQYYDDKDYRNARFVNADKVVNQNWAIKLVDEAPIIESTARVVYCDGGIEPALGHPKVYINLDKPGAHICGYCGQRFQKKEGHHH